MNAFEKIISGQKVVASLRRMDDLNEILNHKIIKTIFMLNCNIFDLKKVSKLAKDKGKNLFVHIDLVDGLGKDAMGIKFLSKAIDVDGIISTKTNLIKAGQEEGLITIQRFFMVDSEAVKTGIKIAKMAKPAGLEILPAYLPQYYLDEIKSELQIPVIAGGLIRSEEDARAVLNVGFQAISTSRRILWNL